MKILSLAFLSMDYVIYNNNQNNTFLALKQMFFQFLKFIIQPFVFYFALLIRILNVIATYNIRLNVLVIQVWEMLWLQVNLFHSVNLSHAQQWKIGFAPFGGLNGGYYFYAAEYHVCNRPMHAAFPLFPLIPSFFWWEGSLLTLQAFNTFLTQELCCWKYKSPASYSHDDITDM